MNAEQETLANQLAADMIAKLSHLNKMREKLNTFENKTLVPDFLKLFNEASQAHEDAYKKWWKYVDEVFKQKKN